MHALEFVSLNRFGYSGVSAIAQISQPAIIEGADLVGSNDGSPQGGDVSGSVHDKPGPAGDARFSSRLDYISETGRQHGMSRTDRSNEGKACDAVLRDIESRSGATRCDLIFPEKTHGFDPVELVCMVGTQRFAFEHTRIEPFAGHIQLEAEAKRHFEPITERMATRLPAESRFELEIPAGAMLGLNDRTARPIQDALVNWILATAPGLPTALPGRRILPIRKVTPPGVPFAVSLDRWPREEFPYSFVIRHLVEGDVEVGRRLRLENAYDKKMKKLRPWKAAGTRAILILEEDDIFLTNHFVVADTLAKVEASRPDRADEVYLLSVLSSMWLVTRLRIADQTLYDLSVDDRFWEVEPSALIDVTGNS